MDKIQNVSLIGLGAIGAAYASRLYDLDPTCIRVIADDERIARYQTRPVVVNGREYEFTYVSPNEETEPADLVVIAVKYDGLAQALVDIRRHVGPNTIILSLLNGISSEEMIAQVYGEENLLYAICVAIDALRTESAVAFSSIGRICFGELRNTTHSRNVQLVKDLFDRANIPYEIPEDMQRTMWWKFMINVGVNQTSAVLRAPYGVFQKVEEAHELMVRAMQEVILVSERAQIHLTQDDLRAFDAILADLAPDGKTSMLQDIEAGRKTEVEYLAGKVRELGKQYGVATPVNDMLYPLIRAIEAMNA
ncbi:ketopantoate reductase family protein [Alicyclobacillus fastidiosus]|uniref:2-dehydropantoate 2-reductase n=1 Tax=Alicyclobacillus fastidiosus TaxID=392011 RepID=A0ABY6ZGS2_9BACL|nr:ketopantoate reductase family protein [Alicyclobacillus fastidiosus]WAH41920.1 ketopantoate reductase family protein [Alicyclobacillus fastidiosus]GMA63638.1 2-dehydropantoate 2-reductase [Alicyclobacillus fastidiosus]